jgi:hypothetical protein
MKEKSTKFEIIIDGKVVKTIKGWERLQAEENKFDEKLYDLDYSEEHSSSSGSRGFKLYFNEKTLKSIVWAWRELTDFVDKNGEAIYYGDYIEECGIKYALNEYPDFDSKKGYYIRPISNPAFSDRYDGTPITAEEIKEKFVVVHKIFSSVKNDDKQKMCKDN